MHAITLYNRLAPRIVAVLAGIAGVSVFLYGALLLGAVSHTAARTSMEKETRTLSASVGALESEFLAGTKALSRDRALELGFVPPQEVATVYAGDGSLTLR